MSIKKTISLTRRETKKTAAAPTKVKKARSFAGGKEATESSVRGLKKQRKDYSKRGFTFREITIDPEGAKSLKDADSGKLKAEIVKWAKRVASYAHQVSGRIGRSMTMSFRRESDDNSP